MATKGADTTPAENIPAPVIINPAPAPGIDAPKEVAVEPLPNHIEAENPDAEQKPVLENVSLDSPAPIADGTLPIPAAPLAVDSQPIVAEVAAPKVEGTVASTETPAAPITTGEDAAVSAPVDEKKEEPIEPLAAALEASMITEPTKTETAVAASSLDELYVLLPEIILNSEHSEMWGVALDASTTHVPTTIVLQKFLRANKSDVKKAKQQLIDALKWRKTMEPIKLVDEGAYDRAKFGGVGYVTEYGKEIVTWNIYGAVKDTKATFGNVEDFMKWRTAVMELSIRSLHLNDAKTALVDGETDPYQMIQIHDYSNVSFLRMDPAIKACSKATITAFALAYPELLSRKFFVNVPLVMSWVFQAVKLFVAKETVRKFSVLGYGSNLAGELGETGAELPVLYGGKAGTLAETGKEVNLV